MIVYVVIEELSKELQFLERVIRYNRYASSLVIEKDKDEIAQFQWLQLSYS